MYKYLIAALVLTQVCTAALPVQSEILYVDSQSAGQGLDGQSWEKAYRNIHDALAKASFGDEIWVAAGRYALHHSGRDGLPGMYDNISLYGGFAGSETKRSHRSWEANETVVTGVYEGEGESDADSYNVVMTVEGTLFDGFIFASEI